MERVIITKPMIGLVYSQVCAEADATDEEILEVCNAKNPSGTSNGWSKVARENDNGRMRPVQCDDDPNRKHFIVIC
jgi:hypothetical protein